MGSPRSGGNAAARSRPDATFSKSRLARQRAEGWGSKVVDRLAVDLRRAFPEMTGISALTNVARTLPATQSELAQQIIKDPYSFDFLSLGSDMLERDLQRGLSEHLRSLILELGNGVGRVEAERSGPAEYLALSEVASRDE